MPADPAGQIRPVSGLTDLQHLAVSYTFVQSTARIPTTVAYPGPYPIYQLRFIYKKILKKDLTVAAGVVRMFPYMRTKATIRKMKKPCDDFGHKVDAHLARLGWTRRTLSLRLEKSHAFISGLVRNPRPVSRTILRKIATALGLNDAEFSELYALAERRSVKDATIPLRTGQSVLAVNVGQALLEIEHEIKPPWGSVGWDELIQFASWHMLHHAPEASDVAPQTMQWPDVIYKWGIVDPLLKKKATHVPPDAKWVSDLNGCSFDDDHLLGLSSFATSLGETMADQYRQKFAESLDRCRAALAPLAKWEIYGFEETGPLVSFHFHDWRVESLHGVDGIRTRTLLTQARRDNIGLLWTLHNTRNDTYEHFPFRYEAIDAEAYTAYQSAKDIVRGGPLEWVNNTIYQNILDARETVRSAPWMGNGNWQALVYAIIEGCKGRLNSLSPADVRTYYRELKQDMCDAIDMAIVRLESTLERHHLEDVLREAGQKSVAARRAAAGKKTRASKAQANKPSKTKAVKTKKPAKKKR